MPSLKADITITIRTGDESFSIGGVRLPDGRYMIKRGRSRSTRMPTATLTEIFTAARKWSASKVRNG